MPILFAQLIPQLSYVMNTIFLGQFGELELRVIGVSGIFYLTLAMVGYGLSNGIQMQMSRRAGEGDHIGLTKTLTSGLLLSVLISLGMMLLCLWLAPIIFTFSLHNQANIHASIDFLYARIWGLPFLLVTQLFNGFFISIQRSRFLIYGSIAATFTNIIFDYLFIFGHAGFPEMGLIGAALASILGELVQCLIIVGVFFFNKFQIQFPISKHLQFDVQLAQKTLKVSMPLIFQYLFSIGGWQIFFIYVEHLGNLALASSQIIRSMFGIIWVGIWAFSATANNMVSNVIGQGKPNEVMRLARRIALLSFGYAFIVCLIVFLFSTEFIGLYRNDPSIIAYTKPAFDWVLGSTLFMSVSTIYFNTVVGTGNTLVNLVSEITSVLAYVIYCYFVIEKYQLSLSWAWGSEYVYWMSLLLISVVYLKTNKWRGKEI